ncbi:MAG: hypothetical protein GKS07_09940 [Nitrosopumilus sp.]|nr:MAG: hypothetical protein GKS07_09940 [Nitrosopumilus sp.]
MPADGPVSITRQTIYSVIPILDIIAFYKVKQLRKYLLIVYVGMVGVISTIYSMVVTPNSWSFSPNYDPNFIWDPMDWILQIPMMAITLVIQIYLVRRWSKKWNEQFSNSK